MKTIASALAAVGVLLMAVTGVLAQPVKKTSESPKLDVLRSRALNLMNEVEKKLLEPPNDGKFGMYRVSPLFVLNVHGKNGVPIFTQSVNDSKRSYRLTAFTLGLFDSLGNPGRVRTSTSRQFMPPPGRGLKPPAAEKAPKFKAEIEKMVKAAGSKLFRSTKKDSWTSAQVDAKTIYTFARTIYPRKECLKCHVGSDVKKPIGVAAITLEPYTTPKTKFSSTPPPSKR